MSNGDKPIIRLTAKIGQQKHSVLSVWRGNYPGTYSISRDKGTPQYPPLGLFDALKAWGQGNAFLNVSVESEREQRQQRPSTGQQQGGNGGGFDSDGDGFSDDSIPFAAFDGRRA